MNAQPLFDSPETSEPISGLASPLKNRQSMVDGVTDRLITAIAVGEYLPGSSLPSERELATSLQVGRVTVRAALARLVDHGLLEKIRGRGGGSFVKEQWTATSKDSVNRTLTARWEELIDGLEAVRFLHGAIARAAAENRTENDIRKLHSCLEAYRQADSGHASQKADEKLHRAIAQAAHNDTLGKVLLQLASTISLTAPAHLWGAVEGMREMELRALADHEQLVAAICNQNAGRASDLGAEHARIDIELFQNALQKAGQLSTTESTSIANVPRVE
ncbi:FadR/GntR family transcriptional regulator [Arthrobacter antibioticus]|uniref:FadR/GntR family transcriptional regulator n=1 Tax=Arthrobacter sp. H35-MC1 TaxID=3046203 RepID=UPI0024B9CBC5|nr:GntR family transcriptional regulator [Arthrobacter sp. H35-MC1]MDJ0315799.1 GntR family transcriptional regulator [Arthrobacter sp. H35-MC1]